MKAFRAIRLSPRRAHALLLALAFTLPILGATGTAAAYRYARASAYPALPTPDSLPAPRAPDPARLTAVVVASNAGTEIIDFLPPYEILAASGRFNVYAVAPERVASPLGSALQLPSGLDFVPHFSTDGYDQAIGADPDLIVVPFLTSYDAEHERPLLDWIRRHAGPRTTILTICAGSEVLADTGLLDGRRATSFHRFLPRLQQEHPEVIWVHNQRYVDDGSIISSAGLASGIDATLYTVGRMLGRDVALSTARALGYAYQHYLDDASFVPPASFDLSALPGIVYAGQPGDTGVLLFDGISETALAAAVDGHAAFLARIHTIALARAAIQSRHGLVLLPRWTMADAPAAAQLLVLAGPDSPVALAAAAGWAREAPVSFIRAGADDGAFAVDAVLAHMAAREGDAWAKAAATNMLYPSAAQLPGGPAWTSGLVLRLIFPGLLGVAAVAAIRWRRGRRGASAPQQIAA